MCARVDAAFTDVRWPCLGPPSGARAAPEHASGTQGHEHMGGMVEATLPTLFALLERLGTSATQLSSGPGAPVTQRRPPTAHPLPWRSSAAAHAFGSRPLPVLTLPPSSPPSVAL